MPHYKKYNVRLASERQPFSRTWGLLGFMASSLLRIGSAFRSKFYEGYRAQMFNKRLAKWYIDGKDKEINTLLNILENGKEADERGSN